MTPAVPTHPPRAPGQAADASATTVRGDVAAPAVSVAPPPASASRPGRRLPWILALAAYTLVVAAVVGWPTPVDANARAPLSSLFGFLYGIGVPAWFDYGVLEKSANVAMFVPFGVLVTGLVPRRWWWGVLAPAAVSGAAELAQHLLLPQRFATWTDVAANTGGAALGTLAAVLVMARGRSASTPAAHRRARSPRRAPSPPR